MNLCYLLNPCSLNISVYLLFDHGLFGLNGFNFKNLSSFEHLNERNNRKHSF